MAILLVILSHFSGTSVAPAGIRKVLYLGWSGVDLFFVLSGFLITGILLDTSGSKNRLSSFYTRRILRIFPLYFLSVIAYFRLAVPLARHLWHWNSLDPSLETWYWLHLSNWKIAFGHIPPALGHFWSLAIEEQFYLFWPLLVFFGRRPWLPYVCLGVIGTSFGLRWAYGNHRFDQQFLYTLTPFRLEPLAFGSLAALVVRNRRLLSIVWRRLPLISSSGAIMLFVVLLIGWCDQNRPADPFRPPMATLGLTAFAVVYASVVLFAFVRSGSPTWPALLLRAPALRAFGKYSYAIYIFHWPLCVLQTHWIERVASGIPAQYRSLCWIGHLVLGLALSFTVGLLSWHIVEKHFLALKRRCSVRY
jgi:peptidoglycan/LPS O-acetylase OafA/YrhL